MSNLFSGISLFFVVLTGKMLASATSSPLFSAVSGASSYSSSSTRQREKVFETKKVSLNEIYFQNI